MFENRSKQRDYHCFKNVFYESLIKTGLDSVAMVIVLTIRRWKGGKAVKTVTRTDVLYMNVCKILGKADAH